MVRMVAGLSLLLQCHCTVTRKSRVLPWLHDNLAGEGETRPQASMHAVLASSQTPGLGHVRHCTVTVTTLRRDEASQAVLVVSVV